MRGTALVPKAYVVEDFGSSRMQIAPIALVVGALLLALGHLFRAPVAFAFFASLAFGSTAIATLTAVGGATLLLYVPLAGLLVATAIFRRSFWSDLGRVFRMHWVPTAVVLLLVYAVASAFLMPRFFGGTTTVFVPGRDGIIETSLRPVSGNINQSGYFVIGVVAFLAIAARLARDGRFEILKIGFFTFAATHAALGLIDFAGKVSGAGDLLEPLRTAGYSMLVEVQVEGFWRITGAYPEASTFAGASVIVLAFTASYWRATNWRPALLLSVVVLILLLLSTSSTGYASLLILCGGLGLSWMWRLLRGRLRLTDVALVATLAGVVVVVLAILVFSADVLNPVQRLIEETLINKSTSASADERFYWNRKSWMAFLDTNGLGVGLGSSRASSSVLAVLSQLGVIGAGLILLLVLDMARPIPRPRTDPAARELAALCNSLRTTAYATMIPAAIAGGGADPGIVFFVAMAGVMVGRVHLRALHAAEIAGQQADAPDSRYGPTRPRRRGASAWAPAGRASS